MEHTSEPYLRKNFSPKIDSTASLLSTISTRPEDTGISSTPMKSSESFNSLNSDVSNKSTLSTAASFFNSHKPHIHSLHHAYQKTMDNERTFKHESNSHHHHINEEKRPHHLIPNPQQLYHNPFSILSKSFTQTEFDNSDQAREIPLQRIPTFIKSLKKSHTLPLPEHLSQLTVVPSSQTHTESQSESPPPPHSVRHNSKSQIDENSLPPPSSLIPSPSMKPTTTHQFKVQKERLINQFQFFMKFQSNAKRSDAIYYAPLRLESMNEFLLEVYEYAGKKLNDHKNKLLTEVSEKSSVAESTTSLNRYITLTNSLNQYDTDVLEPVNSTETTKTNDSSKTVSSGSEMVTATSHLTPKKTRILLMQLWVIQAWKMLVGSSYLLVPEIRKKSQQNFESEYKNSGRIHQICYLQNQFNQSNFPSRNDAMMDENELNWSVGWQLAYDEPHSRINNVFLTDWDLTPKIILDGDEVGLLPQLQLSDDLNCLKASPIVNLANDKKLGFFKNYSLFTTVSYKILPLKSNSQDIVYCHDLECSVQKESWVPTLNEISRVLVPGGYVQLVVKNFEIFTEAGGSNEINHKTPTEKLWRLIRKNAENAGFEIRPCRHIMEWLKIAGFKDIKYALLSAPKTVTPIKGAETLRKSSGLYSNASSGSTLSPSMAPSMEMPESKLENLDSTSSLSINVPAHHHKTSYYKDERLNNFTAFLSGLTEYSVIRYFTDLSSEDERANKILLDYIDYRNHGDGSGKIFQDEGYAMFMVVTARI